MNDYKIRAMAAGDTIRAFAITAKDTTDEARKRHNSSPVVTAGLGRMLMGASMMSMMEKKEDALLTLQAIGDGPMQGITVTAGTGGLLKGFANVCDVDLPPKYKGKLDVGGAIGPGILRVMRDEGAPEPYVGTVELVSGEIAEDLTYYFAQSEQTPSAVGLGVLIDVDTSVKCAGGFIVQLMPEASDQTISILEENIKNLPPVTEMMDRGYTPEMLLEEILKGLDITILEKADVAYRCDCGKERITKSLLALNKADLQEMIDDGKPIEVRCQFCNEKYNFSIDELVMIADTRRDNT